MTWSDRTEEEKDYSRQKNRHLSLQLHNPNAKNENREKKADHHGDDNSKRAQCEVIRPREVIHLQYMNARRYRTHEEIMADDESIQ